jgi:hypothetical protein
MSLSFFVPYLKNQKLEGKLVYGDDMKVKNTP